MMQLTDVRDVVRRPLDAAAALMDEWATKLDAVDRTNAMGQSLGIDPADWIEENFFINRPRDPKTAEMLPPGNIVLADYQRRVIREALSRTDDGKLRYMTVLWSEPKKSGKTAIAAAAGLFMASMNPAVQLYCLANDGKQSADRILKAMATCIELHIRNSGPLCDYNVIWSPPMVRLPNGTKIEAIPCDAAGEAGAEPFMTIWSELWGYRQAQKDRLWTEMTIPPTLYGYALRWVESYAGYEDESTTLWKLYDTGVNEGRRLWDDLPVYVNDRARQLTFWSHESRQPWQTDDYYIAEAETLIPNEFRRIHKNEWVTSSSSLFDDIILWDKCKDTKLAQLPPPGSTIPMVIGLDASVSGDCTALVVAMRHPDDDYDTVNRRVAIPATHVWEPPKGGKINYALTLEPKVRWYCENYNIVKVVYDPYQLHKMCTDLRMEGLAPFQEFSQRGKRLVADKQLYDMILHAELIHSGDSTLRQHAINAASNTDSSGKYLRIVKKADGRPVDAVVAASMASYECLRLNLV